MKGRIKKWDFDRGFGFVACTNGRNYFLHISNWGESDAPAVGAQIEFEIGPGQTGKAPEAIKAHLATAPGLSALESAKIETIAGIRVVSGGA